jgi:protein-L-isoaspartate(D-aspartate) O-methyltransferase
MFRRKNNHIDFTTSRQQMVEQQLKPRGVKKQDVLDAMSTVPRHLFVDENFQVDAYDDGPLPIGYDQTISQPYIVASMTEHLGINKNSNVLEIGTGCGYQTAVLAELVSHVYSIEIIENLYLQSKKILHELHYKNISLKFGNGYLGWQEHAPFDAIILTAAAPQIPEKLIEQLEKNGTMVLPITHSNHYDQELIKITKNENELVQESLYGVRFVPMTGANE